MHEGQVEAMQSHGHELPSTEQNEGVFADDYRGHFAIHRTLPDATHASMGSTPPPDEVSLSPGIHDGSSARTDCSSSTPTKAEWPPRPRHDYGLRSP